MWSMLMIAQAIGWLVLIVSSPLIFLFARKVSKHFAYALFPRDTIIQYQADGCVVEAYYVRQSLFKRPTFRKLSPEELLKLEIVQ